MSNYSGTLVEFSKHYDLFDRFVQSVDISRNSLVMTLDMYHCDDPVRNDESKDYIMSLSFSRESVETAEDPIPDPADVITGTVLEYEYAQGKLSVGIEWRLRSDLGHVWSKLLFTSPPQKISEEVRVNIDQKT